MFYKFLKIMKSYLYYFLYRLLTIFHIKFLKENMQNMFKILLFVILSKFFVGVKFRRLTIVLKLTKTFLKNHVFLYICHFKDANKFLLYFFKAGN